jgi:hypothetical protein
MILARIIFALVLLTGSAQAQMNSFFPGPGTAHSAGAAFTGIGDTVTTGWFAAWGTRAFSAATRGNKLINACDSTGGVDVSCADMLSDATTGDIVPKAIGGITCPNVNCTIKIYYDISGQTNCTGAVACDMTRATVASRAKLTANALGGASTKSCGVSTGAATYATPALAAVVVPPHSVTATAKYSSTTGGQLILGSAGGTNNGYGAFGGFFALFDPSTVNASVAFDTTAHTLQYVANGASSFVTVDTTTSTTQNSGSTNIGTTGLMLFTDQFSQFMSGVVCEAGLNTNAFSGTNVSNLNTNQQYWFN